MTQTPLKLFNSLTRQLEEFQPVHPGEARVYSCGPTVYNYQHIGNMRAYVFADTLGRTLQWKGYRLTHVINITDVGHLTSDADEGEDKMEKMAAREGKSAWDIAKFYQEDFERDLTRLNVQPKQHPRATEYVAAMIEWAERIAPDHCYELESGLYFDVSTVADYGRLARDEEFLNRLFKVAAALRSGQGLRDVAQSTVDALRDRISRAALPKYFELLEIWETVPSAGEEALQNAARGAIESSRSVLNIRRIEPVPGKRNDEDFAIWRKTPPGETRQMEWDSPWGRGAPGWHLECSVMGEALLGFPFDIHTGGIDHREIHHPNEIAQNQAYCCTNGLDDARNSGANIWMHNNFLVERSGKMSKSSGEFLRLQLLVDKGFHPLAYRMMCLQAHYRSELEFSWEGLEAALVRLKRMVMGVERLADAPTGGSTDHPKFAPALAKFGDAMADDLNTAIAVTALEDALATKKVDDGDKRAVIEHMDAVLGLNLFDLTRADLRIRPKDGQITEVEIEAALAERKEARAAKDFARSDALRDELAAKGVEVMDGDPLGWEWKL